MPEYVISVPVGAVIRPIELLPSFANHKAPSGPAVIAPGPEMPR